LGTPLFKTSRYEAKRVDDNRLTVFIQANIQQASVIIDFRRIHIVNFRGRASWKAALPLFVSNEPCKLKCACTDFSLYGECQ
jgi:hypothetical protein